MTTLTTETAPYVLRRKPQTDRERANRAEALRTLALAGWTAEAIEMDGMTTLSHGDLAVIHEALTGAA
jgi:hypothetical protein